MSKGFKHFHNRKTFLESWGGSYIEYWLDPRGRLIRAERGHWQWAMDSGLLQIPGELWENRQFVYLSMAKKGYIRVTIVPPHEIFYQKYIDAIGENFIVRLTTAQRSALVKEGQKREKNVVGVGDGLHNHPADELFSYKAPPIEENAVMGVTEPIEIDGIGSIKAKVDSGNDGYNVIHGVNITRFNRDKKVIVKFESIDGKTVSFPQQGWVEVVAGGETHQRPVILLNIRYKNQFFQDEPFSVADRSQNDEKVLLGVPFLKRMDAIIDVNKNQVVSEITNEGHREMVAKHNDRINREIEALNKEILDLEAEREYAAEIRHEPYHRYNVLIAKLQEKIKDLEGGRWATVALSKEVLQRFLREMK